MAAPVFVKHSQHTVSVPVKPAEKKQEIASSLFTGHALPRKNEKPQLHFTQYDYAIAGILFIAFLFFVWLYVKNRKRLGQVIKAFYVNRFANQLLREEISVGNRISVILSGLFILTTTLFFFQANRYFGWFDIQEDLLHYSLVGGFVFFAYAVKVVFVKFMGFLFQVKKEASDYLFSLFLFGNTLGLFLLPLVVCLAFAKQLQTGLFAYSGLILIFSFIAVRMVRGLMIGMNSVRVSKFYLFLYLCTLEIVPLVVLLKLFLINLK